MKQRYFLLTWNDSEKPYVDVFATAHELEEFLRDPDILDGYDIFDEPPEEGKITNGVLFIRGEVVMPVVKKQVEVTFSDTQ